VGRWTLDTEGEDLRSFPPASFRSIISHLHAFSALPHVPTEYGCSDVPVGRSQFFFLLLPRARLFPQQTLGQGCRSQYPKKRVYLTGIALLCHFAVNDLYEPPRRKDDRSHWFSLSFKSVDTHSAYRDAGSAYRNTGMGLQKYLPRQPWDFFTLLLVSRSSFVEFSVPRSLYISLAYTLFRQTQDNGLEKCQYDHRR